MPYEKPPLFWGSTGTFSAVQLQSPVPGRGPRPLLPLMDRCLPPLPCPFPPLPPSSPSPFPSVAKALCVKTVAAQTMKLFREHPIFSEVVSDQEAVAATEKFVGMCQVLSSPNLLVQELSACPFGLPRDSIHCKFSSQFHLPSLPITSHL